MSDDVIYNPRAFEAARARLTSAPGQLTDSDIEQLAFLGSELARQGIEQRHKALHPPAASVPRGLDVDAVADAVIDVIGKAVAPLAARIASLESRPMVKYCGVHTEGTFYPAGSLATRSGGLWHATTDTQDTPGADGSAWVLIVKRGQA